MDLNERIRILFYSMINFPEKIVNVEGNRIEFDNHISIEYWNKRKNEDVKSNEPLKLKSYESPFYFWNVNVDVEDHLVFTIDTPYKQYSVPDFTDRIEYANVLNILDNDLIEFEKRKLTEYELHFSKTIEASDDILPF